jgi:hypothetical protein
LPSFRAASISAGETAEGGGAAALIGSANTAPAIEAADSFSQSRLDD